MIAPTTAARTQMDVLNERLATMSEADLWRGYVALPAESPKADCYMLEMDLGELGPLDDDFA